VSAPAVRLDHVTLEAGGRTILREIDLSISQGEFIGVLGPNGAGKTTLFRAILGLHAPASGNISVLGKPVVRGNAAIGYLPQVRSSLPPASIAGADLLAASVNGNRPGIPLAGIDQKRAIDRALAAVDAAALARRPIAEMSGGERQRLLVAQALLGAPRMLLLDEPLIGLDPYQQHVIVSLVRDLSRSMNLTVLFSAHELNQLLGAIERVLYLGNGRAALGSIEEVIRPDVLSPLYGAPIEVVRAGGHIFVMSGGEDIERSHAHDHGHHHPQAHGDHARL
jgi:zinc/manganese transport system ATP-binding protein